MAPAMLSAKILAKVQRTQNSCKEVVFSAAPGCFLNALPKEQEGNILS